MKGDIETAIQKDAHLLEFFNYSKNHPLYNPIQQEKYW